MNTTPYAGFWRRTVAFILDSILAALPPAFLCVPLLVWQATAAGQAPEGEAGFHITAIMLIYFLWQVLGLACMWLYFAWMESSPRQATLGKRLLKIKVVGKTGERISFARASARFFAKFLGYLSLYVGFIMAGLTNRKRALHDYVVETYVVKADFEPGNEMPNTPSHPVWLGVIIAAIGLFFAFTILLGIAAEQPGARAIHVASQLQMVAEEDILPYGDSLPAGDIVFSHFSGGYRAVFPDTDGQEYSLYLPKAGEEVCCESYPGVDCANIGFKECE